MKIVLSPLGVYGARLLAIILAAALLFARLDVWLLGATALGLAIGTAFYAPDYRERSRTGEGATLEPMPRLRSRAFWEHVAIQAALYGVMWLLIRVVGGEAISAAGWIGGMTLVSLANENLRAQAFGLSGA